MAYYYCENDNLVFNDYMIEDYAYEYRGEEEGFYCLNITCCGELIKIDENIAETIVILNKKGYITIGSCSGHLGFLNEAYIQFKDNYNFETLPKGFIVRGYMNSIVCKEFELKDFGTMKRQADIWETAKDLLEWAESLPDNKLIDVKN